MEIKKKIVVPTGEIYTAIGEKGMLEFLTVGDYGKNANIKADFLGITRDLNGVPNGEPMPLTEKWVIPFPHSTVALWAASSAMFQKWVLGEMPLLMI